MLYENSEGLVRLQEVLKMTTTNKDVTINVRQLLPAPGGDYRYENVQNNSMVISLRGNLNTINFHKM